MESVQNIELQDMMNIVHGLKMSGLSFVEPDALDYIQDRINELPSSEQLEVIYDDPREVKRLCAAVGSIMKMIEDYGMRNEEFSARHKAKTKLPPRYKVLKWEKAGLDMRMKKKAIDDAMPQASSEIEAAIQETINIENGIRDIQNGLKTVNDQMNNQIPMMISYVNESAPQLVRPLTEHKALIDEATLQLNNTSNLLISMSQQLNQTATQALESSRRVSEMTQQTSDMVQTVGNLGAFTSSTEYIKNVLKLSKNLEGEGILPEKLLTYAKNLRDGNRQAIYDLREIEILLRRAEMNKEADTLLKTAQSFNQRLKGAWDSLWGKGQQGQQGQQAPGQQGMPEYVEQTGEQWQREDIEQQFNEDIDWLKRSWDNLVTFFKNYVNDADVLVREWNQRENVPEETVSKINELKTQAQYMLAKVEEIQKSENFNSKTLLGGQFEGTFGQGQPKAEEGTVEETQPGKTQPEETQPEEGTPVAEKVYPLVQGQVSNLEKKVLNPFLLGNWKETNWEQVEEILKGIDAKMYRTQKSKSLKQIKIAAGEDAWINLGIDPRNESLNALAVGDWNRVNVSEVRGIIKKIKDSFQGKTQKTLPQDLISSLEQDPTGSSLNEDQIDKMIKFLEGYKKIAQDIYGIIKTSQESKSFEINRNSLQDMISKVILGEELQDSEITKLLMHFHNLKSPESTADGAGQDSDKDGIPDVQDKDKNNDGKYDDPILQDKFESLKREISELEKSQILYKLNIDLSKMTQEDFNSLKGVAQGLKDFQNDLATPVTAKSFFNLKRHANNEIYNILKDLFASNFDKIDPNAFASLINDLEIKWKQMLGSRNQNSQNQNSNNTPPTV